ncbi:MAG TPA: gliding motility-associated C-terminal domain-containing protein [Saprospiraceae bacterium]|nr:gliding motility-associated C-terminal domain-containing protein [Saprospiraceae bacterium]
MKKFVFSLALLCMQVLAFGQLNFQIANVSGNKNDTVSVPVTVASGFNNIFAVQFSMAYDSNVLAIVDVVKTANFDVFYATHVGSVSVKNGQLTFSWDAPGGVPKSLNNGTLLYTIRFKLIGKECDSSFINVTDKPTNNEVLDANLNSSKLLANTGKVKINGTGCQGGGPPPDTTGLQIIASMDTTPAGVVKCIKVTTRNFKNIQTMQFTVHWDKAVATFDTLNSGAINLTWGQNYAALPDRSGVGINWDAGINPVTLADGVTLFEICLKPVGAPGTMTNITFDGNPVAIEVTDGNGNVVTTKFTTGKLTIAAAPALVLNLHVRDTMVEEGAEFCIPVRADNFTCVQSFQFSIKFDSTKLSFSRITGINLPALGPNNFNIVKDSIRVTWDASTGAQTLPNGGVLFMVCFTSKLSAPNCPFDTRLVFTDLIGSPLEFYDCNNMNFAVTKGEPDFTVKCRTATTPVSISIGTRTAVKCFGDCNGSVRGTLISGGKGPFDYEWRLQPSNVVVSTVLEPTDLCPGRYRLTVIDRGNANSTTTSVDVIIDEPEELVLSAVIKDVTGINDGSIDLTVEGGTPNYTYKWRRLSSGTQIATTEDISGQSANNYEVMVTDANGCVIIDTFTINPPPLRIVSISLLDSNRCNGDCRASLFVSAGGGRIPYKYEWNHGRTKSQVDSLCKGVYTVTVTDNGGATTTASYTITEPDKIDITLDSTRKASAANGAAFVTIKGGTLPYKSFQWKNSSNMGVSAEEDLRNVVAGTYTLCVTDKNDCVICLVVIIDPANTTPPVITIGLAVDPKPGGNAVSCTGVCDGRIIATVTSSDPRLPYRYRWSHDTTLRSDIATGLCPGRAYTVTVTDAAGNTKVSSPITVQDAPAIVLTAKRLACASSTTASDGSYEAVVSGAAGNISYSWCNGNTTKVANNLSSGDCKITVTDANGCTAEETFTVCVGTVNAECYQGRLVISPNGDGYNEYFEINCASTTDNVLTIYDRWGNQVYSAINYINTWDGKDSDGDDLTEGTYMWVLKVTEPGKNDTYYKGTVTIVR